jgi:hypothetical protein
MIGVEDRVREATRAIAGTVHEVRPLVLPASEARAARPTWARRSRTRRWTPWAAPVTAAVAVIAIALTLVSIRHMPNEPTVPASRPTTLAMPAMPAMPGTASPVTGVPEYYIALSASPTGALTVRNTFTGAAIARVSPPRDLSFTAVGGSSDDRTFVVTAHPFPGPTAYSATEWYLLRIASGAAHPVQLTRLPVLVTPLTAGFALSPDGRELAMAVWYPLAGQELRLYSVPSGKLLRTWSSNRKSEIGAYPSPGASLAWLDGGKKLAFVFGGNISSGSKFNWTGTIRVLDVTKPGSSLTADSSVRLSLEPGFTPEGYTFSCDVADGWTVSTDGQTVTCAGVDGTLLPPPAGNFPLWGTRNCGKVPPAGLGFTQYISFPSGEGEIITQYHVLTCSATTASVYLAWSDPSGSIIIGSVRYAGHEEFGIFRGKRFTPLPEPPADTPLSDIAW